MINVGKYCRECPDKFPGCHGSCSKYLELKEEFNKNKAEMLKNKKAEAEFYGYVNDNPKYRKAER